MKLLVGNEYISRRILSKVGTSKMVLFKIGKGSGGDVLLKQMFDDVPEGTYSVMISTHQTEEEILEEMVEIGINGAPELVSLLPAIDLRLKDLQKKDRFISEGIMVTDLLEISSLSKDRMILKRPHTEMLSALTKVSSKQVLPFRMVIDSLVDFMEETSKEEVIDRLRIIKKSLRNKGGLVLVGCPLGYSGLSDLEPTLFDAVIEVKAEKRGEVWFRSLTIAHVKGSGEPPEEWAITILKEIPTAIEVD